MSQSILEKTKDQSIYEYKDYTIYMEEYPPGFGHRHAAIVCDSCDKKIFEKSFYENNHPIDEVLKLMMDFIDIIETGRLF